MKMDGGLWISCFAFLTLILIRIHSERIDGICILWIYRPSVYAAAAVAVAAGGWLLARMALLCLSQLMRPKGAGPWPIDATRPC